MSDWRLLYEGFDGAEEGLREALCTLSNGYFATRGALPESAADGTHYPATYIAGVYNRLVTEIGGRSISNESIVNVPNWLPLRVKGPSGAWFDTNESTVVSHHVELDPRRAILTRRTTFEDDDGRRLSLTQRRFVSMRDPHLAALETTIVPENWSGRLVISSAIDGDVRTNGVARYAGLGDDHLVVREAREASSEVLSVVAETTESQVRIAIATRTRLFKAEAPLRVSPSSLTAERSVAHQYTIDVREGDELTVEKTAAVFTSRDAAIGDPAAEARAWAAEIAGDFDELLHRHQVSWHHLWSRVRLELGTDGVVARTVHLHLFHLMQTLSNNTAMLDVGVPARGLHGEAYRGHVFWDELFVFPWLSLQFPQLTRALLLYRYRRLDAARRAATDAGLTGAMYPWQSASTGKEETQQVHLNPKSGRWLPDASHLQRHVNAAVALNVWQYYQATGDQEFLRFFGGEMLLEIARFWASIATYNRALDRYEIKGVMGPDEYHERYPDRDEPGLDNNAYTNVMAAWCMRRALDVLEVLPAAAAHALRDRLELRRSELDHWDEITRKMRVCFHDGVISQFEGYEDLEELDWPAYREKYGNIERLDRILEAEGDSPNRYKLSKQADVLMLFFVLSADELEEMLRRMGYGYDPELIPSTIDYYEQRTAHGSTLSRVVDSWVHARRDRPKSWKLFLDALRSDIDDTQAGTTAEGIHLGAMAGTLDLLFRCYAGLEAREDALRLNPAIPEELGSLSFDLRYRGYLVSLEVSTRRVRLEVDRAEGAPITVSIRGVPHQLEPGERLDVPLAADDKQ